MERRKFLLGAGSAAVGASAVIGSGAFSSVIADRDADVTIAADQNAYLGLQAGSNGYVSQPTDGIIEFNFDENADGASGSGLNNRADTVVNNAFTVANQSDRDLYVWVGFAKASNGDSIDPTSGGAESVELLAADNSSSGTETDLTYPPNETPKSGNQGRALDSTSTVGAVKIPSGDSRVVDMRFLVNGSNSARDADFRFVFFARDADEGEPTSKSEWVQDVNSDTGNV